MAPYDPFFRFGLLSLGLCLEQQCLVPTHTQRERQRERERRLLGGVGWSGIQYCTTHVVVVASPAQSRSPMSFSWTQRVIPMRTGTVFAAGGRWKQDQPTRKRHNTQRQRWLSCRAHVSFCCFPSRYAFFTVGAPVLFRGGVSHRPKFDWMTEKSS